MLRFQKGRQEAFDELVRRNTPKIQAMIFRFLGDGGHIEDLTQEVFLRIYRTAKRYTPTAKFSTWLYRIAANLSFNVLRTRSKIHPVQLDTSSPNDDGEGYSRDVPDEKSPAPVENLSREELRSKVIEAINSLPETQKMAIILNRYEHKNYEEIAQSLDCSTMAVKSLLSRARTNLQSALERYLKKEL